MLEKSMGLLFYLKKRTGYVKGTLPIYLRITINGMQKEVSTKRECLPDRWNQYTQRVKGTNEEAKSVNAFLESLTLQVYDARRKLMEDKEEISADALKNVLMGNTGLQRMLLDIFQNHNDQMYSLIGKEFATGTHYRYKTTLEHTRNFIKYKYQAADIPIAKLDYEFVSEFEFWLKSIRSCGHNSAIKYIANLKKIVNKCIRNGWLHKDPFIGFKLTKREVERIPLTPEELHILTVKQFSTPRLTVVKDCFLFSCYTGLAFVDVDKLKYSEIVTGVDGDKWIFTNRQKTETSSRIPLVPAAQQLLAKYEQHPQCILKGKVLPILSNQKMNAYLKEIADLCGIEKNLTFHLARHTFATTVLLSNGVPMESVSKMLGHKNIKTTQMYGKVLDTKISNDMQRIKEIYKEAI